MFFNHFLSMDFSDIGFMQLANICLAFQHLKMSCHYRTVFCISLQIIHSIQFITNIQSICSKFCIHWSCNENIIITGCAVCSDYRDWNYSIFLTDGAGQFQCIKTRLLQNSVVGYSFQMFLPFHLIVLYNYIDIYYLYYSSNVLFQYFTAAQI
jgi:hypothetical protein